jgi:Ca2+-binding EF-hand superfamily protein
LLTKKRLRAAFDMFDKNGDGSISYGEVRSLFITNG